MTDAQLGWIAGFFDGEGNVSYYRSRPSGKTGKVSPQLCAQIAQKGDNREVLDKFQSIIGFGKIYGPYPYKTPAGRTDEKYVLVYNTNEVEKLLIILKPNLGSQKMKDFRKAILAYYAHDPEPNEADIKKLERKMAKHPHRLMLFEKRTWRCTLPGCTFFVHTGLAHILPGKMAQCWGCGDEFMLDGEALRDAQPKCSGCRGLMPVDEMKVDEVKLNTEQKIQRTPEQQAAYDKIMKELGWDKRS